MPIVSAQSRRLARIRSLLALAAFALAALIATGAAVWAVGVIERSAQRGIAERLQVAGFDWAAVATDGLMVTLSGTADSEAERFRALQIASTVVDAARVIDDMAVVDPADIAAPRFTMEILRNDDGVSLIGLVPTGFGIDPIRARIDGMTGGGPVTDMLETADHPIPAGWATAVDFGLDALAMLPRSKISIAADRVAVTAITADRDERRRIEAQLARAAPGSIAIALEISAPRPVIAPFTLRFIMDERGARFDACAADTEAARDRIRAAAAAVGAPAEAPCTIGLGTPSPDWGRAAAAAISAVAEMGAGSVTFSDADVSLIAPHSVDEARYDAAVARLDAALPEVFSLDSTRLPAPVDESADTAPVEFIATLSDEGAVLLRGRIGDAQMRAAVQGLARARFGTAAVQDALRLDENIPEGWLRRVMTGVEALALLHEGRIGVRPDSLTVTGRSGDPEVSDAVSRLLAEKLGAGQSLRIDVTYDETLDPVAMAPTPDRCIARIEAILAERKITFAPGAIRLDAEAGATLDAIAEVLRECGELELVIGGHTDSQGRAESNLALSQRRADAVREGLAARRVLVAGIEAVGYGQTRPIADNATAEGREANRRIEFRLRTPPAETAARDPEAEAGLEIPVAMAEDGSPRPRPRPAAN
jgi:OOP family OmpA-OmpF porin